VPTFLALRRQSGPAFDRSKPLEQQSLWLEHAHFMDGLVNAGFILLGGPLSDDGRVMIAVQATSAGEVRETFARDPWSESHLVLEWIEPWTIRLDGRPGR
jgi:hypothetical protein